MKKFTLFLSAMLISLMSFAQTVPTQEELWASFQTAAGLNLGTLDNLTAPALNTISGNLNADNLNKVFAEQEWQWLKTYVKTTQDAQVGGSFVDGNGTTRTVQALVDEITDGTNVINWRYAVAAFFVQSQYVGYPAASADFTEAGKPEAWGPAYLAAQESTTPELTTVTLTYELTKDAVQDRMGGRRYVTTEDAEFGSIQLVIPGFSADVAEYAEASLAVGDSTYAATATFAADAENNKEVYTAHAVSADTIFDATFTIFIPATQEYTLTTADAVAVPEVEDDYLMYLLEGEFVVEDALVPYELYVDPGFLSVMGTIGEAFVLGEGAEKVIFEIDEEEFYLKATLADDAGNTYNVEMIGVVEGGDEPIVELVLTDTVDVTLYNLTLEPQGPMATVNAGGEALSFGLTLLPTENYYGFYFSDSFSNIWYGDAQLQPYGDGQYSPDGLIVAFTSTPDAEGKATLYNFTLIAGDEPVAEQPEPTYTENKLNTYAFGLESELNDTALVVTYRLNNSNATSVNVLVYKGEEVVATVAGTTTIGVNTVVIPVATLPQGRMLTWSVEVNGTSVEAPTQEAKTYDFYHPSGVDIDNNPENPTFGMLLVNEGMQAVLGEKQSDTGEPYVSTEMGAGIYAFTPSFDLIPNGDQPGYNGGIEFTTGRADGAGTAYSPRRIRISEDGRIFVTSLNTDGNYLWEVNPANMNEWTPVFQGTLTDNKELITADSNFVAAPNNGFDVKGAGENLQLMMYSVNLPGITGAAMSGFRCDEYNLGTATSWATAPSKNWVLGKYAINYTGTQVVYDNEGGIWIASYRGTAEDVNPGLVHINADGVEDVKLIWSNVRQAGIRFNSDFTKLVVAGNNGAAKKATIYAVSKDANGAPVLTEETVIDMAVVGNNLNDFAFDYAGNLYACGNSAEKLIGWAMPYSGQVVTPAASKYAFHIGELLPDPVVVTEMVGVVKRAVQNGDAVIVLTHEADGTAHIYEVANGTILELLQNGVVPVDPENKGSYLAISDIAVTEDGKLVANNYVRCQFAGTAPEDGYKLGTSYYYIWDDLTGAPRVWFTSQATARSSHGDMGKTFAVKGTSTDAKVLVTAVHNNNRAVRMALYSIIDGVYEEPDIAGGTYNNDYYFNFGLHTTANYYKEATQGKEFYLLASPLADASWIIEGELSEPSEFLVPAEVGADYAANQEIAAGTLGNKYQGTSIVTVGEQVLMVAPYATAEGLLAGVKVLDITAGLDAATEVATADLDAAVEATAAATAIQVVEGGLVVTLVADATIYTLNVELKFEPEYPVMKDNITNLIYNAEEQSLSGGPSTQYGLEVFLVLGQDNLDGTFALDLEQSSIALNDNDLTILSGYVKDIDLSDQSAPAATAVIVAQLSEFETYEFHLTMTSAPAEVTIISITDAAVVVDEWKDFPEAPTSNYALTMTADWTNEADGLTYPVKVEVLIYDPNVAEQPDAICNVVVGDLINGPWLGGVDGCYLTITTVEGVVTAKGVVTTSNNIALNLTISGKLPTTALDNIQVGNETVKVIRDGQLIIIKNDVEYNIQGAVVK